ncbi:zf-HC2 domain-containing protein [bacterium]
MQCKDIEILAPDYLADQLNDEEHTNFETHINGCDHCHQLFSEIQKIWQEFISIPEQKPKASLRHRFDTILADEKTRAQHKSSIRQKLNTWINTWWPKEPGIQLAYVFGIMIISFLLGSNIQKASSIQNDFTQLKQEVQYMRQTVSLSLLEMNSPFDRLKGIQLAHQVEQPSENYLERLFEHINQDPNINVRLAAVEALYLFSNQKDVYNQLIISFSKQTSPLVQIALIDLMTDIRERKALRALKKKSSRKIKLIRMLNSTFNNFYNR